MNLIFVELPLFTSLVSKTGDEEFLIRLQNDLLQNPNRGDLVPRLHGLRKIRARLRSSGKRGGARVIYLHLPDRHSIILFYLYMKTEAANLTPDQERRLRGAVDAIKKEFCHE